MLKIKKSVDPGPLRAQAYRPAGDQLDAIIRTFAYLDDQGIDIGPDGRELIQHSESVKATFKKHNNWARRRFKLVLPTMHSLAF